jgi:exopolysaccharide biosynthesis polyprenyl glycosylphosphotransferase
MPSHLKRVELIIAALLVPLDYAMLLLAGWLAYWIRFGSAITGIRAVTYPLPLSNYLVVLASTSVVMVAIFALNGLYSTNGTRRIVSELRKVFLACSTGILIVMVLFFFNRELFSSRFIILTAWVLSIILVSLMRYCMIQIERALFKRGIGVHRVLLIGASRSAAILYEAFQHSPALGYVVSERAQHVDADLFDKLSKIIKLKAIDDIIVADQELSRQQIAQLIEFTKIHHLDFKYAADIFDAKVSHVSMRPLAGIPLVELRRTPLQGWGRIFKRALDLCLATLGIIVFSPFMIATAIAVKLDSPGKIIYRNRRVGENGREFDTLKFRSMKQEYCISDDNQKNSEALALEQKLIQEQSIKAGPVYKIQNDPRVTRVGRWIRKLSLDEFPQFFNVLRGDMSLVGPRPHQPREVAKYADYQRAILTMKPGVTGLSQISGRSDLEFVDEMRLDTYYMENWSIGLDLYIIFKTPFILFNKRKAE